MIPLSITTNLELNPWTDVDTSRVIPNDDDGRTGTLSRIGVLPNGTEQGRAVVVLLVDLSDGRQVIAETTLRLFLTAAAAVKATPVAQMEDL